MGNNDVVSNTLKPGDMIVCKGVKAVIKDIINQDYWDRDGYCVEFKDTNGIYRNWKQWIDGGTAIRQSS